METNIKDAHSNLISISNDWESKWEEAISLWSKYLKIRNPQWFYTEKEENDANVPGSIALIRLDTHQIMVSMRQIKQLNLEKYSLEIMAHEIGHHVYCPANLANQGKLLFRIRAALKTLYLERMAPQIANLYSDLMINNKLKQEFGLKMDEVYTRTNSPKADKLWTFYMRVYELLWGLPKGLLALGDIDSVLEGDAVLGNRIIRNYSNDWLLGASRFAMLCLTYLNNNNELQNNKIWFDSLSPGSGNEFPDGLIDIDEDELEPIIHPAMENTNEDVDENNENRKDVKGHSQEQEITKQQSKGQCRDPFELGEILKDLGLNFDSTEITIRYYKERSIPYLVPFPKIEMPNSEEPMLEGTDTWDIGSPMQNINWFQSAMKSPVIIPGYTTLEDYYGTDSGSLPAYEPVDLDIYIDCSGSMPNPSYSVSYLALAGTIIALSALRAGSKIQATLWSGAGEFHTTNGFINNEKEILQIVTGYLGGATAFPNHILRDTYSNRKPDSRKVHILIISDDGVSTLFDTDEKGNSGRNISLMALKNCGGGGTMVLQLYGDLDYYKEIKEAGTHGWDLNKINNWNDLIEFAAKFSKKHYGDK